MKNVPIIPICEHIKDNGIRCGTPALRGRTLCYHHDRLFRRHRIANSAACIQVPSLTTERNIRRATTNVLRACRDGQLPPEVANTMLYGFQIARSLLNLKE